MVPVRKAMECVYILAMGILVKNRLTSVRFLRHKHGTWYIYMPIDELKQSLMQVQLSSR